MKLKPTINKILVEVLLKKNLLTREQLDRYIAQAQTAQDNLETHLIRQGILTDRQIMEALSLELHLETIDLRNFVIDRSVIDRVPVRFTSYYKFVPVRIEGQTITLAVSVPLDVRTQDDLRVHLGLQPKIVLALEKDIYEALKKYYGLASDMIERILTQQPSQKKERDEDKWVEDIERQSDDPSVAQLVNQILLEAYQKRATDIHIEPYRNKIRLRYRVDGVLVDANLPNEAKHFLLPMISRIKIMSNLSITERRAPQDGSAIVRTKDQDLDLRVSTIPTPHGESMVIRILPTKTILFSLEKLGFNQENVEKFREMIKRPHGIIFVTGPTGSGKTTSLYACLHEINLPGRKIITIEDPVEYEMEGITQIQVNAKVDLDFAKGLRSILRHDPDILMVGEVRDLETAEIAIRTALTGHLVFSTLHTNDAASGVTRLIDMGVEPYLVASSVEAFVAQRLVRVICPSCKEEDRTPLPEIREEMAQLLKINLKDVRIFKGKGCDQCNQTGFFGRTAIYEIMELNEFLRAEIIHKPRAEHLKYIAVQQGMRTLRQDGWKNVCEGITTPGEVLNVTVKENLSTAPVIKEQPVVKEEKVQREEKLEFKTPTKSQIAGAFKDILVRDKNQKSRTFLRIVSQIPVRYVLMEPDPERPGFLRNAGAQESSKTKDISAAGLTFTSSVFLQPGTILDLIIDLETGKKSIECLGKVCRVEEGATKDVFMMAVYYLEITNQDRDRLNEFVKTKLNENLVS